MRIREQGQTGPRAFTLVELLVVIAIISVLAALLMPALQGALRSARRIVCLSGRKQNYVQFSLFASDHDGLVPFQHRRRWSDGVSWAPTPHDVGGNGPYHGVAYWVNPVSRRRHTFEPIGTMALYGYVSDPGTLFCPDFDRNGNGDYQWDKQTRDRWEKLTSQGHPGFKTTMHAGISHYLWTGNGGWNNRSNHIKDLTIHQIADLYKTDRVSPLIFSCAQVANPNHVHYSRWDLIRQTEYRSHNDYGQTAQRGLNGVFYDGSARWIDVAERGGFWGNLINTPPKDDVEDETTGLRMINWALESARPRPPN